MTRAVGRTSVARTTVLTLGGMVALAGLAACAGDPPASNRPPPATAAWTDTATTISAGTRLTGTVPLAPATHRVVVEATHATVLDIPDVCTPSTTTKRHSFLLGGRLVCQTVSGATSLDFAVRADGAVDDEVGASVRIEDAGTGMRTTTLGPRTITAPGSAVPASDLRLVSSPDFTNGDIGDLRHGPNSWRPGLTRNSTNPAYTRALDTVLDDWKSLDPAGVLVAGDLVDGRWGFDDHDTGVFGPTDTVPQRRAALRRAARTYYPQWEQRFTDHGLSAFPAPGDHEYGDNDWPGVKRRLASTYRREFAREFTRRPDGSPVYPDHPPGPAGLTAYAGRPTPDVQIVSLDEFDIGPGHAEVKVDRQQLRWLKDVLKKAQRDGVRWIVVQGHVPVLWPVPIRGSSGLHYPGADGSKLWRVLERFGVDLYLCGEVHDTSVRRSGGVTQVAHGGEFQFGLTTALSMDFRGDDLWLGLRDYRMVHGDGSSGRLFETRREGLPSEIGVEGPTTVIGTAVLHDDGHLTASSGILRPID